MSTDARVTKDLIQTLEDGKDGFAKAAEKLADGESAAVATTFRELSEQRARMSAELDILAQRYGDDIDESGSVAAAVHRGWMTLRDAITGSDPHGVIAVAEQGEDHAVREFEKALEADISTELQAVVVRQLDEIKAAHDTVKALRDAAA
jgi:uncharacterized protein (TIGR02284 family)